MTAKDRNKDGQSYNSDRNAAAIDTNTSHPFNQIVSASAKDKPFVSEEGRRDGYGAGQDTGEYVAIFNQPGERPVQECEQPIAEYGVESAHQTVANELRERLVGVEPQFSQHVKGWCAPE